MSHAVPAGSQEVTAAFNFISERTVLCNLLANRYYVVSSIVQDLS
jgi:hypothetical protein